MKTDENKGDAMNLYFTLPFEFFYFMGTEFHQDKKSRECYGWRNRKIEIERKTIWDDSRPGWDERKMASFAGDKCHVQANFVN